MRIEKKKEKVKLLEEILTRSSASFIIGYRGLRVDELTELRRKLRESKALLQVVKNTLLRRGAEQANLKELVSFFKGPTGIVFALEEPVAPVKKLREFMREHPNLKIKGGILSQDLLDAEKVLSLAVLPEREILLAQFLTQLNSSLTQFVRILVSPLQNLIFAINSIINEKKEGH